LHIKDDGSLEIQCGDLNPLTLDKKKQRERVTFQDDDYSWFVTGTSIYVTLPSNHSTFEITAVNKDLKHLGLMDNTPVLMKKFVDGVMYPPEAVHGVFYIKDYGSFEVVSIKDGHRIVFEIDKKDQTDDITFKVGEKTWTITKTGISINAIYKPSDGKQQRQTIEITVNDKPTSAGNGRLRKTKRVRRR
jgi:hypothetical protein